MGAWSVSLYGNDVTVDVRDTYIEALKTKDSDEEALKATLEVYQEYMDTDEECLVWYALADLQWKNGRLCDAVKDKAFYFLKQEGGKEFFEKSSQKKWLNTLQKLETQLLQPMKEYKKYKKETNEPLQLWELGDVYAYRFSTKHAKEKGLYGKYILMQKVDEIDKLFDEIPSSSVIKEIRLLPVDSPYYEKEEYRRIFPLCMSAVMQYIKAREYPKNRLTYLGKEEIRDKTRVYRTRSDYSWYRLEESWLCSFYLQWQGKEYVIEDGQYYPESIG